MTWTKKFKASGVEGMDVVKLLNKAIKKRGVSIFFLLNRCIRHTKQNIQSLSDAFENTLNINQ